MLPILLLGIGLLAGCTDVFPFAEQSAGVRATADPEMCAEHGVLEAVCTRCNPALAAVFEAKGDWCAQHDFPESFCPICHPELGGRPLEADLSADGSPPDGTRVRFRTREAASLAGIETEPALEAPWASGTEAVARLAWDATRVALVSPRADGSVTAIRADVGTEVRVGSTLALMRSAHVAGDRSRAEATRQGVVLAETELSRKRTLFDAGVSPERQVLEAEQAVATARAEHSAIQAELGLVGGGSGDSYAVTSPIAGVVTQRLASLGQAVSTHDALFEVVDASRMWAELDVAESDLGRVRVGQAVHLTLDAMPDRTFSGQLDYLAPSVDPSTRTALARVVLENPDGDLRAHMYGTARILTGSADAVVTVPAAAVQRAGTVDLVFVRESDDSFVGRRVTVVARAGGAVRIAGPIAPGDAVVTTGSFLLKTETLKDSIGAGCCDVE